MEIKYLCLPSMVGRRKNSIFSFIKDWVGQKIYSWSNKCLSQAGWEILIKFVLQVVITTYVMRIFLLTTSLCDEIEKMINSLWWDYYITHSKDIHRLSWNQMATSEDDEYVGFKNLTTFNVAMLGKQGWHIMNTLSSLISWLFKAKYFSNGQLLDSSIGHNPSFVWRGICSVKHNDISIWNER